MALAFLEECKVNKNIATPLLALTLVLTYLPSNPQPLSLP